MNMPKCKKCIHRMPLFSWYCSKICVYSKEAILKLEDCFLFGRCKRWQCQYYEKCKELT